MLLNLYGTYRHIWPNTRSWLPRLSCHPNTSNPSSWCCNRTITSGSPWQCSMCMLVRVYQHVHKSLNSQTVNFHQIYVIILTQHLNNCTIRLKVTRQWPLAVARHNFAAAEQQSRCRDIQARCSGKHPPLGLSDPRPTRYHKSRSCYSEYFQYQKFTKPNLLFAANSNPAATSSNAFQETPSFSHHKKLITNIVLL